MFMLLYVLAIGPEQWPVSAFVAYAIAWELIIENVAMWSYIVVGLLKKG